MRGSESLTDRHMTDATCVSRLATPACAPLSCDLIQKARSLPRNPPSRPTTQWLPT